MGQLVRLLQERGRAGIFQSGRDVESVMNTGLQFARNFWFALKDLRIKIAIVPIPGQAAQLETSYLNEETGYFFDWITTTDPDWLTVQPQYHRITKRFVEDWPPLQVFILNTLKSIALPQAPDRRITIKCGNIKRRIRVKPQ